MTKGTPKPFSEGASSFDVGGLTVENGIESIAVYGQVDLTRDKAGLAKARAVLAFMQAVVAALEAEPGLPDAVPAPAKTEAVKNPFS